MLDALQIFTTETWLLYIATALFSLCMGSFLNVVIYRIPLILDRDWRTQCHDYLELDLPPAKKGQEKLSLAYPGSSCPHCGHKITALENIPVLSYLVLKGKCSSCKTGISIRYPLVEILTALLSVTVIMKYGISYQALAALIFTWTLIALAFIDYDKQLLPDNLTLPLLWLGLVVSTFDLFTDTTSSIVGAASGYMVLWLVFQSFKMITGKEGMGFGDFKLLAALGAWTGWSLLPQVILISSVVGSITGILMVITGLTKKQQPIPFGPYLAMAGWIALLWGNDINSYYLQQIN